MRAARLMDVASKRKNAKSASCKGTRGTGLLEFGKGALSGSLHAAFLDSGFLGTWPSAVYSSSLSFACSSPFMVSTVSADAQCGQQQAPAILAMDRHSDMIVNISGWLAILGCSLQASSRPVVLLSISIEHSHIVRSCSSSIDF